MVQYGDGDVDGDRCKKKEGRRRSGRGGEFVVGSVVGDSGALKPGWVY